jgi:hypothetical protein
MGVIAQCPSFGSPVFFSQTNEKNLFIKIKSPKNQKTTIIF